MTGLFSEAVDQPAAILPSTLPPNAVVRHGMRKNRRRTSTPITNGSNAPTIHFNSVKFAFMSARRRSIACFNSSFMTTSLRVDAKGIGENGGLSLRLLVRHASRLQRVGILQGVKRRHSHGAPLSKMPFFSPARHTSYFTSWMASRHASSGQSEEKTRSWSAEMHRNGFFRSRENVITDVGRNLRSGGIFNENSPHTHTR